MARTLLGCYRRERHLYAELLALALRQHHVLKTGDLETFNAIGATKEGHRAELKAIEQELAPLQRAHWASANSPQLNRVLDDILFLLESLQREEEIIQDRLCQLLATSSAGGVGCPGAPSPPSAPPPALSPSARPASCGLPPAPQEP